MKNFIKSQWAKWCAMPITEQFAVTVMVALILLDIWLWFFVGITFVTYR